MKETIEVQALKTFRFGAGIVSPKTGPFEMTKHQFVGHETAGLVRKVRPTVARSEKSSASQAGQASPKQTAKKSAHGATRTRKTEPSSSPTPPIE